MYRNRLSLGILFLLSFGIAGFSAFLLGTNDVWKSLQPDGSGMAIFVTIVSHWCVLIPGVVVAAIASLLGKRKPTTQSLGTTTITS